MNDGSLFSHGSGSEKYKIKVSAGLIFFFFNFLNFIVVQVQVSAFSPHDFLPPQPSPPPSLDSTPTLGFVYVSFIVVPENPSPFFIFSEASSLPGLHTLSPCCVLIWSFLCAHTSLVCFWVSTFSLLVRTPVLLD